VGVRLPFSMEKEKWRKRNGEKEMEKEKWRKRNGEREMEKEKWRKRNGEKEMEKEKWKKACAYSVKKIYFVCIQNDPSQQTQQTQQKGSY